MEKVIYNAEESRGSMRYVVRAYSSQDTYKAGDPLDEAYFKYRLVAKLFAFEMSFIYNIVTFEDTKDPL